MNGQIFGDNGKQEAPKNGRVSTQVLASADLMMSSCLHNRATVELASKSGDCFSTDLRLFVAYFVAYLQMILDIAIIKVSLTVTFLENSFLISYHGLIFGGRLFW